MPQLTYTQKLATTIIALILLVAMLIGYPLVYRQFSMMEEQFNALGESLADQAASSATELIFTDDNFGLERLIKNYEEQAGVISIVIVNRDGDVFGTLNPRPQRSRLLSPESFQQADQWRQQDTVIWFREPIRFQQVVGGSVWIALNKAPLIDNQRLVMTSALTAVALLVLSVFLLAIRLSRNLSKPINELIDATQALGDGRYHYRLRNDSAGEFASVKSAFNSMAESLEMKNRLEKNISRFVSSPVAQHYMTRTDHELTLSGERVEASIIFVDLVSYTPFSNRHAPETVAEVLNLYFTEFSRACHQHHGIVDKFIGDCAMLVFGCPLRDDEHREHALECALYIRKRIQRLNRQRQQDGLPWMDIRIGLAGGTVLAGLLGSSERMNYSVIGDAANLAARLCDKAPHGGILTERAFLKAVQKRLPLKAHETQQLSVKGFDQPIDTLIVDDVMTEGPGA